MFDATCFSSNQQLQLSRAENAAEKNRTERPVSCAAASALLTVLPVAAVGLSNWTEGVAVDKRESKALRRL